MDAESLVQGPGLPLQAMACPTGLGFSERRELPCVGAEARPCLGFGLVFGLCILCLYSKFEVASYKSIHKTLRAVVLPLQEPDVLLPQPLCPDPELCTLQAPGTTRPQGVFCLLMLVGRKEMLEENGCLFIFQ